MKKDTMRPVDETIVFDEIGLIENRTGSMFSNSPPYSVDIFSVLPDPGAPQDIEIGKE